MGADLYYNPPREPEAPSLDQQVKNIMEENRSYRRKNAELGDELRKANKRIKELEQVLVTITKVRGD